MRVLVTRAADEAGPLCSALQAAGATPVCVPLVVRIPGPSAPSGPWDLVVLTSAAAAESVRRIDAPVACVGEATAERARSLGLRVTMVGAGTGADLVAALGPLAGLRVLFPRAAEATPDTAPALRAAGADLTEIVAYENVAPEGIPEALAAVWPVDAVTLMSGSAARRLADGLAAAGLALGAARIVVIGPSTAEACVAAGLPVHAVAARPDLAALVEAVRSSRASPGLPTRSSTGPTSGTSGP